MLGFGMRLGGGYFSLTPLQTNRHTQSSLFASRFTEHDLRLLVCSPLGLPHKSKTDSLSLLVPTDSRAIRVMVFQSQPSMGAIDLVLPSGFATFECPFVPT